MAICQITVITILSKTVHAVMLLAVGICAVHMWVKTPIVTWFFVIFVRTASKCLDTALNVAKTSSSCNLYSSLFAVAHHSTLQNPSSDGMSLLRRATLQRRNLSCSQLVVTWPYRLREMHLLVRYGFTGLELFWARWAATVLLSSSCFDRLLLQFRG